MKQLRNLAGATTPAALAEMVKATGMPLGQKLSATLDALKSRNSMRTFIAILAMIFIAVATYLSYKGAGFIFAHGGIFSLFFGVLDIILVVLLWRNLVTGAKAFGVIGLEALTFIYFGYTIAGYFGGGSLESAANKRVTEMYSTAREAYLGDVTTLHQMTEQAKSNAKSIKAIEEARDGKGPVYEKATLVSSIAAEDLPKFTSTPLAPKFTDLPSANQWLQAAADQLNTEAQKYQSMSNTLIQQAQGTAKGIREAYGSNLTPMQSSNLHSLEESMNQIGAYKLTTPKIEAVNLTAADFQVDVFQKIMGYAIEGVIFALLLILTLLKPGGYKMDELRQEAGLARVQKFLDDENIPYDAEWEKLPYQPIEKVAVMMADDKFKEYVKRNGRFNDFVGFAKKHPTIIGLLMETSWRFADVKKALEADPNIEPYMTDALQVQKTKWDEVSGLIDDPEKAVELTKDQETLKRFLEAVDSLRRKVAHKHDNLKKLISQLLVENPTPEYFEVLQILCEKLPEKKLKEVQRSFIALLTPETAKFLVTNCDNDQQFANVVRDWGADENALAVSMLSNNIARQGQFGPLMRTVININGVPGFRKIASLYEKKHTEAGRSALAQKVVISQSGITALNTAINNNNVDEMDQAMEKVFELQRDLV